MTIYGFYFPFYDATQWGIVHFLIWTAFVLLSIQNMNWAVINIPKWLGIKPVKAAAMPLPYTGKDRAFVVFAKFVTIIWTYHFIQFAWLSPQVRWNLGDATVFNTVIAFLLLFVAYDFFYYAVHRVAHHGWLFKNIHRHHHRQTTPVLGNQDGINAHPLELVLFEYLHILAAFAVCWLFPSSGIHILALMAFFMVSGLLSGLGHTRHDINIPYVWRSQHHVTHHSHMNKNFGQYVMLWDVLFRTFRPESRAAN